MSSPPGLPREIDPRHRARVDALRAWSRLLDSAFRVPGTRFRFGWDPILGLIPGLGDALSPLFSCLLIVQAFQLRIPKVVQMRMVMNVVIDMVAGVVPVAGDLFDFAWKSNEMNLRLLEQHAAEVRRPGPGDWAFAVAIPVLLVALALLPLIVLIWAMRLIGASWL